MEHNEILEKIAYCIEFGKIDRNSPFPPNMKGQDGAGEYTRQALEKGIKARDVLNHGLMQGMDRVGRKFRDNKIFVPQVLMSAKAMNSSMEHLMPYFTSGEIRSRGKFIIGTVMGDLHDIGKNLVSMILKGNGWEVIDLGIDVGSDKFLEALEEHPGSVVGLSALLTTTMANMKETVEKIKGNNRDTCVAIGGAPVTQEFCEKIGADIYSPDPQGLVDHLDQRFSTG